MSGHSEDIPGYTYGREEVAKSPVTAAELDELKASVMFSADDEQALLMAGDVLEGQVSKVLDTWYGFVAGNPLLLYAWRGTHPGVPGPGPRPVRAVGSRHLSPAL